MLLGDVKVYGLPRPRSARRWRPRDAFRAPTSQAAGIVAPYVPDAEHPAMSPLVHQLADQKP